VRRVEGGYATPVLMSWEIADMIDERRRVCGGHDVHHAANH